MAPKGAGVYIYIYIYMYIYIYEVRHKPRTIKKTKEFIDLFVDTFFRESPVFLNMQNTAVPEGSRKEQGGFPEGVPEGFFSVDFFVDIYLNCLSQGSPEQPRAAQMEG